MKQIVVLLFCLMQIAAASAQDMVSLKGEPILPEEGDWGLMFDVIPFLKNAGNIFYQSSTPAGSLNEFENTLVIKKYKEENRAIRFKIRLGYSNEKFDTIVVGLSSTNPEPSVTDSRKISQQNIAAGVGFQKNHGKGRLRGYTGLELLIRYSSTTTTYTYGDGSLSALVWTHTNTFGQGAGVTEVKDGNKIGLNLRYILGAEFFFAPKMSLSAEYSWGITYFVTGEGTQVTEYWDFPANKVKTSTKHTPRQPTFVLDNLDALSINLAFYF